ncbi:HAD family hydrolase [Candidatus Woesearchaeota archaeon]|nr:HAD family hydrolase [Candidatus Woesearchaeota archaeon]
MIKAIIFDFWGTVVENGTYSPLRQSYSILRPRMPFNNFVPIFEQAFMTQEFKEQADGFKAVCEALDVPAKPFVIDKLIGTWNKNRVFAKLFPETIEVLETLKKKHKLVLVSNCDNFTTQVIEKFELGKYFDAIVLSYKEGKLKTEGLFDCAVEELGVKKTDILVVGDSLETDVAGAEKAGLKAVLVDRKGRREHPQKIPTLKELPAYVEEL